MVADVRQGKYFEIDIAPGVDAAAARAEVDKIAQEILANPVIEDYHLEIEE
jgi:phosphoribosylformylglycinamidine synthase